MNHPRISTVASLVLLALEFGAFAFVASVPGYAQIPLGNPLGGLESLKSFKTMRTSSCDPDWKNGNADARGIQPGATLEVAHLEGPGKITHIWCTIAHSDPFYSRMLTLRIYWDGEEAPSVECPIGDFFGIGHGVDRAFDSIPIKVSSEGRARNCYWPMPFRKSARITVTNDSDLACGAFYYYVDWQKHDSLPEDAAYFHAMYRQEHPCIMGRNYLLADIVGRGHYVGTIQSVYHTSGGWYGEGDDFFFIDGEQEPSLRGTGTEDYFCDAWGFRQQDGAFYGTPLWEGYSAGDRSTAYRFHITDPVAFTKSLRVEIEHKGSQHFADGKVDGFIERDDLMSSVAIWYQIEPHQPWPAMPAAAERLPFREIELVAGWRVVESCEHSEHQVSVQEVGGTAYGKQLWLTPQDDSAWVEIPFELSEPANLELVGKFVNSWDYGIYDVLLDGQKIASVDLHSPSIKTSVERWGLHSLAAGQHVLRLQCTGKSPGSTGYLLGFDVLKARVPAYQRPEGFDLRNVKR